MRWLVCLIPFFAATIMVLGWPIAPDNDLYFHLRAGERVASLGGPLLRDLFTYTVAGSPDEAWHSWWSQWVFWKIYSRDGFSGLRILNLIVVFVVLGAVAAFVIKRAKNVGAVLLSLTIVILIHQHSQIIRPILFGEMCFAITVFLLLPFDRKFSIYRLLVAVIVTGSWANLHGSVVIMPVIFTAYAFGAWCERKEKGPDVLAYLSPGVVGLVSLCNPKGLGIYQYSLELTRLGKLAGNSEWGGMSPIFFRTSLGVPYVMTFHWDVLSLGILLGGLGCVSFLFRGNWRKLWVSLLCVILPFVSIRHSVFLMFPVVATLCAFFSRSHNQEGRKHFLLQPGVSVLLALVLLFSYRFYQSLDVIPSIKRVSEFIESVGLKGNVFCEPAWSNYLLFKNYPNILVAADNRTMVNRNFFLKARDLYADYGYDAWALMIAEAPEETDFLLISSWRDNPPYEPSDWLVIYENNHATLVIKRNDRNRSQIERVRQYYREVGIPFDGEKDFSSRLAFQTRPKWFESQLEKMDWGKWPQEGAVEQWKRRQKQFYESRKFFEKSPLG